jgi:hypothetical protein
MRSWFRDLLLAVRYLLTMARVLWAHRGGRRCGPNCRCRDHF